MIAFERARGGLRARKSNAALQRLQNVKYIPAAVDAHDGTTMMITPHKFVAHRSLRARGLRTAFLLAQRRLSFRAPARFEAVEVRYLDQQRSRSGQPNTRH